MLKYSIPPDYCLIINAFSQASTLRSAAKLLQMDPSALVRKVKIIANEYDVFKKLGNRWALSERGLRVAQWTHEMMISQTRLLEERPRLRISSFAWLAEEVLIPNFQSLNKLFGKDFDCLLKMTATQLEDEIIQNRTDIVLHGTSPNDPAVAHKRVSFYPWVVVTPIDWKRQIEKLGAEELKRFLNARPFIRHSQINPDRILKFSPATTSSFWVDSVIGLRSGVVNGMGWTALPAMSIQSDLTHSRLHKTNLKTYYADDVSVWWLRENRSSATSAKLIGDWVSGLKVI